MKPTAPNNIKISIVIPLYNAAQYLAKCLDSILNQNFTDIEVIIVDDGSTDNSADIYTTYEQQDSRIQHIKTANLGSGNARNEGLQHATGTYIFFCDPDDWVENDIFADNYAIAQETKADAVFFGVNNYFYDKKNNTYSLSGKRIVIEDTQNFRDKYAQLYFSGLTNSVWNKLYRREFLQANLFTFPRYAQGQDLSFNLQVYQKLQNVAYNKNPYYNYVKYSNHTAITRYIAEKASIYTNLIQEYKALFASWDIAKHTELEANTQKVLFDFWFNALCSQLRNIYHFDSPDTHKTKAQKCKQILNELTIHNILATRPQIALSKKDAYFMFCIQHKFRIGIEAEIALRQFAKRHLVGIYTKLKH